MIVSDGTGSFEVNIISLRTCTETLVIIFDWVGSFEEDVISLHVVYWDNLVSLVCVHCNTDDNFLSGWLLWGGGMP